jgi:DNA primase
MTLAGRTRFDAAAVRHGHRIEAVVAASGVELTRRGQGFMGCCPFHDDSTASLSVGGVPERFHCFGCNAGGDVIEYVARLTGLTFVDAARTLEAGTAFHGGPPATTPQVRRAAGPAELTTTPQRAHAINHLAWEFFTTPANASVAETYLRQGCGIDVGALCAANGGEPIVGYAGTDWHALTRHLHRRRHRPRTARARPRPNLPAR